MATLSDLKEPFDPSDIEWRIAQRGERDGKPWAKVLAYVTNRAIMERLDEIVGPQCWKNEFKQLPGAFLCGLSIKVGDEWITKWDGAQESQIEATKGGLSGAMKRAAVQWGIGRYLYNLEGGFADVSTNGKHYAAKDTRNNHKAFKWNPPTLPEWALPTRKETIRDKQTIIYQNIKSLLENAAAIGEVETVWKQHLADVAELPEAGRKKLEQVFDARCEEFKAAS